MKKILIIEDEPNIAEQLLNYLTREGFMVEVAETIRAGAEKLSSMSADLIILDWRLPDGEGIDLLRQLRSNQNMVPVIMVTARVDVIDKVIGLELGANDYITKPFEPRELLARVKVQARLAKGNPLTSRKVLSFGSVELELEKRKALFAGVEVDLTKKEYDLLHFFIENPGKAFSRDELLNNVWGYDSFPNTRTVDSHVVQLRQKFNPEYISTVRGFGYRWEENAR